VLVRALVIRSALFAVLLFVFLEALAGSVDYPFLVVSVFAVVVMHEAFHMIGMEGMRTDHSESFRFLAVGYAAANLSNGKVFVAIALPFGILLPFGFLLTLTGMAAYVALGWSIIIMHAILLPVELSTLRSSPSPETAGDVDQ
jgi:hypothetical protein